MGLTRTRGMAGEAVAAAYLELKGCAVVARNRRMSGVEVDLVVSEGSMRVLVEVKFRGRADYGGAAMAVDRVKRERLLKAARALSAESDGPVRIDVVAVELSSDGMVLHHYRNAVTE